MALDAMGHRQGYGGEGQELSPIVSEAVASLLGWNTSFTKTMAS